MLAEADLITETIKMVSVQQLRQQPINVSSLANVPLSQTSMLPAENGVYLALDNAGRVWYVGIAQSIRGRFAPHDRMNDFRESQVTSIAWKSERTEAASRSMEKTLIEFFHPPLNFQHNFNELPAIDLGLSPEQEIERFLRLRVQLKIIELELELLKPNMITRCEQSGGKIAHRLGSIRCNSYKSWQYSEEVEVLKQKLKVLQEEERTTGKAAIKSESVSPVARLNGDAISNAVCILLAQIDQQDEQSDFSSQ
jgi:hypothetical protein